MLFQSNFFVILRNVSGVNYYISNESMSWIDCKNYCTLLGGNLLEVRTQEEFDQAQNLRSEIGSQFWLGGSYREADGEWRWESNDDLINMTQFWADGQPYKNERCLTIYGDGFYDNSCSSSHQYVCHLG